MKLVPTEHVGLTPTAPRHAVLFRSGEDEFFGPLVADPEVPAARVEATARIIQSPSVRTLEHRGQVNLLALFHALETDPSNVLGVFRARIQETNDDTIRLRVTAAIYRRTRFVPQNDAGNVWSCWLMQRGGVCYDALCFQGISGPRRVASTLNGIQEVRGSIPLTSTSQDPGKPGVLSFQADRKSTAGDLLRRENWTRRGGVFCAGITSPS